MTIYMVGYVCVGSLIKLRVLFDDKPTVSWSISLSAKKEIRHLFLNQKMRTTFRKYLSKTHMKIC